MHGDQSDHSVTAHSDGICAEDILWTDIFCVTALRIRSHIIAFEMVLNQSRIPFSTSLGLSECLITMLFIPLQCCSLRCQQCSEFSVAFPLSRPVGGASASDTAEFPRRGREFEVSMRFSYGRGLTLCAILFLKRRDLNRYPRPQVTLHSPQGDHSVISHTLACRLRKMTTIRKSPLINE